MALERINFSKPVNFQGMEDLIPQELQGPLGPFIMELTRRLVRDRESLLDDLYKQVVVDPSILPDSTGGSSTASTNSVATQNTVDLIALETQLMGGV